MHSEIWVTEETKVTYPNFANSNSGPKSRTPRTDNCFGGHTVKSSAGNRPCEWVQYCGFLDGGIICRPSYVKGLEAAAVKPTQAHSMNRLHMADVGAQESIGECR